MGFSQAARTCLFDKYAHFEGRASRSEYWWFAAFCLITLIALSIFFFVIGGATWLRDISIASDFGYPYPKLPIHTALLGIITSLVWLALVVPSIAVTVRRFHDREVSGWWVVAYLFTSFIPILGQISAVLVLVFCCLRGTDGKNRYGSDPLR